MINAEELNGSHIGKSIRYLRGNEPVKKDEITMITHKKNKRVIVRYMPGNYQHEFQPYEQVEVF